MGRAWRAKILRGGVDVSEKRRREDTPREAEKGGLIYLNTEEVRKYGNRTKNSSWVCQTQPGTYASKKKERQSLLEIVLEGKRNKLMAKKFEVDGGRADHRGVEAAAKILS